MYDILPLWHWRRNWILGQFAWDIVYAKRERNRTTMMSKAVQDVLNEQIKNELYSAYIYLSMSAYCESANLKGAARWMRIQSQEEVGHALKIFDFINDRGGNVILQAIDQPPIEFKSLLEVFQGALEHERKVTGMIHRIYDLAVEEKDYPTQVMMQWFIEEQVEEEKSATEIVENLKRIGDNQGLLVFIDQKLGERESE
jgi:ferritin